MKDKITEKLNDSLVNIIHNVKKGEGFIPLVLDSACCCCTIATSCTAAAPKLKKNNE